MPRKIVPVSTDFPYHVSARCINRDWFKIPLGEVWLLMEDYLYLVNHLFRLNIHSFVLMPNHFHLIVSTPEGNLSAAMNYFMRETSREITRLSGRINQTYGGRHHKTLIGSFHYFMNAYKYVYRNPVRAKICERVEEYPYSTLAGKIGLTRLIVPVVEDTILFNPRFDWSAWEWLNRTPKDRHEEEIRKALKRPVFELPPDKIKAPSELENQLM